MKNVMLKIPHFVSNINIAAFPREIKMLETRNLITRPARPFLISSFLYLLSSLSAFSITRPCGFEKSRC